MSEKGQAFLQALEDLCRRYGVVLSTSGYDGFQVWDAGLRDAPVLQANGIEDKTAGEPCHAREDYVWLDCHLDFLAFTRARLNQPGTIVETEDGSQYLIGDVNMDGGVCDDCKELYPWTMIVRYAVCLLPPRHRLSNDSAT